MGISSAALIFLTPATKDLMYPVAILAGAAQAFTLNTGITLISEVIGVRGASGAFVFGVYSFLDKISSGIAIFTISIIPAFDENNKEYIRSMTVVVPAIAIVLAWVLVMVGKARDYETGQQGESRGLFLSRRSSLMEELA